MTMARCGVLAVVAVVAVSCSGGDAESTTSTSPATDSTTTSLPDGSSTSPSTSIDPATPTTAPASPTTSVATTTTTTTVPPEPYRAGVVWSDSVEVLSERTGLSPLSFRAINLDDELWAVGVRWNGSVAARSTDGGASWTEVTISVPSIDGSTNIEHLVRSADGRYLAVATRGSSCRNAVAADDGFGQGATCTRYRPVVFTSDDGVAWTESAPGGLAPPGGASLRINDVIAVESGFIAAGTVQGPGWHSVLFSSPDGVTWTNERELVGDGNPYSSRSLAFDGSTMVLTVDETPCGQLNDGQGGWALGSGWAKHGRIFAGADIASLALQPPGDHPLAPAPLAAPGDCNPVEGVPIAFAAYPKFTATTVDGVLTIFELHVPAEQTLAVEQAEDTGDDEALDDVLSSEGTRRYAQLVDGAWQVTDVDGVNVLEASGLNEGGVQRGEQWYTAGIAADPAFVQVRRNASSTWDVFTVTDADPAQQVSAVPLVLNEPSGVIAIDDGYLMFAGRQADPFRSFQRNDPIALVAWHTSPGVGPVVPPCQMSPGGACRWSDLSEHPDYPDFSDRDLSGIDMTGTDLGSANFDGADLTGARLWMAAGDFGEPPSFVGADLTDAAVQSAEIGDVSRAVVAGANFRDARIRVAADVDFSTALLADATLGNISGSKLGSTDLSGATFVITDRIPDLAALTYGELRLQFDITRGEPAEFDLSGVDLTGVTLSAPSPREDEGPLVIVTSLDGATLMDTLFLGVDLSRLDPTFDLGELRLNEDSICPDGNPATGGFFGTCTREVP